MSAPESGQELPALSEEGSGTLRPKLVELFGAIAEMCEGATPDQIAENVVRLLRRLDWRGPDGELP